VCVDVASSRIVLATSWYDVNFTKRGCNMPFDDVASSRVVLATS